MTTARLYDDLVSLWRFVSPPESYPEEVATFRARFQRHGVADGARVLHLGSGGGSVDYHLGQHYQVTGVDLSEGMLAYARTVNPGIEYLHGDIRSVRLGRTFDAVLLHDAISYMTSIDDLDAAYRTAAAHLEPGGVMVALPEELRSRLAQQQQEATIDTHSDGGRTVSMVELSFDPDPADHSFETTFVFLIQDGGELQIEVDRHLSGVFELEEFMDSMRRAGFDPVAEPWDLPEWKPDEIPMPLITAVKLG